MKQRAISIKPAQSTSYMRQAGMRTDSGCFHRESINENIGFFVSMSQSETAEPRNASFRQSVAGHIKSDLVNKDKQFCYRRCPGVQDYLFYSDATDEAEIGAWLEEIGEREAFRLAPQVLKLPNSHRNPCGDTETEVERGYLIFSLLLSSLVKK